MTDGPRHWSDLVANLLSSRTGNLRELAEMANCDWRTLYRGQSLAGCHLEGQDLRGMDLSGCDIELAKIDDKTLLDPQFDPRKDELDRYRTFFVPTEVDEYVRKFASAESYIYIAWAYKNLFERFYYGKIYSDSEGLLEEVLGNSSLAKLSDRSFSGQKTKRRFQIGARIDRMLHELASRYPGKHSGVLAILGGLVRSRMICTPRPVTAREVVEGFVESGGLTKPPLLVSRSE